MALKVFDEGYLNRTGALERFRREAIAAGRLEHPRIVPVYDAGETEGRAFMSMRLIPGDSLAERIARNGPLPPEEALAVLSDIGEAIDFAHARGTVHRDVKTGNILLDPEGASYLSDFGLVRLDDMPGLTRRGDWLGTAEYVSPEQVEGEPATPGSDLYSLAVVAFETLTGRPPFVRREPSAVLLAHVRDPVPDASAIVPSLPPAVDEVLARGLAKDPQERPESAGELIGDLRAALGTRTLRPAALGVGAAGTVADPWDAAMVHFGEGDAAPAGASRTNGGSGGGFVPVPERLTQAFGDAARRRGIAMKRDVAIAAGIAAVVHSAHRGGRGMDPRLLERRRLGGEGRGVRGGRDRGQDGGRRRRRRARAASRARRRAWPRAARPASRPARRPASPRAARRAISSGIATGRSTALDGPRPRLVRGPDRLRRQRAGGLQLAARRH